MGESERGWLLAFCDCREEVGVSEEREVSEKGDSESGRKVHTEGGTSLKYCTGTRHQDIHKYMYVCTYVHTGQYS